MGGRGEGERLRDLSFHDEVRPNKFITSFSGFSFSKSMWVAGMVLIATPTFVNVARG